MASHWMLTLLVSGYLNISYMTASASEELLNENWDITCSLEGHPDSSMSSTCSVSSLNEKQFLRRRDVMPGLKNSEFKLDIFDNLKTKI